MGLTRRVRCRGLTKIMWYSGLTLDVCEPTSTQSTISVVVCSQQEGTRGASGGRGRRGRRVTAGVDRASDDGRESASRERTARPVSGSPPKPETVRWKRTAQVRVVSR